MKLANCGQYSLEVTDNILLVDAQGPFDQAVMDQFVTDMHEVCKKLSGRPWGSLVTYYGNGIFTPEAEEGLIAITKYRVKHGMVANASIIMNSAQADLQQMQLQRIYQASKIRFHVFSEMNRGREWLTNYINQQCAFV